MNGAGGRNGMQEHPLRFCMLTTFYPPYSFGGDGIFVHALSNALARRGHQVHVVHCVDSFKMLTRHSPPSAVENHRNVHVHQLRSAWGRLSPFATYQTGQPFFKSAEVKRILEIGFDVIHYHNISLVGGPGILHYGSGIKLYTTHEYWLICPTHTLFKLNREVCQEPQCLRCTLTSRRLPQWWRGSGSIHSAASQVNAFLSPSLSCLQVHQNAGFSGPFVHLPGFASAARWPAEDISEGRNGCSGSPPDCRPPYFLYAGRLEKLKGLHTVIPIFRERRNARLLVAGQGSDEPALRRLSEGMSNVEFLGQVADGQLSKLYREAVAVIVPSLCLETFSLVTVEAFQHGTPVIGRKLGGVAELIEESGGGIAYETEQYLPAIIERLLGDPGLRQELGKRGFEAYQRRWSEQVHLKQYFEIIGRISGSRRAG